MAADEENENEESPNNSRPSLSSIFPQPPSRTDRESLELHTGALSLPVRLTLEQLIASATKV